MCVRRKRLTIYVRRRNDDIHLNIVFLSWDGSHHLLVKCNANQIGATTEVGKETIIKPLPKSKPIALGIK